MMKKIILITLLSISLLQSKNFDFLTHISYLYGLNKVQYNNRKLDGELTVNSCISYEVGTIFRTLEGNDNFDTALRTGFTFTGFGGDPNTPFITEIPLFTIVEYYTYNKLRFGAGLTYHYIHSNLKVDNAIGKTFSIGIGYHYGKEATMQIAVKAIVIDYKVDNVTTINGNSIGLMYELTFKTN